MEIACTFCSTKLNISEDALPKNAPAVKVTCPKCQRPFEVKLGNKAGPAAAQPSPVPAPMVLEDDFEEGRKLAMACFNEEKVRTEVKTEIEALGFFVQLPESSTEALARLRKSKYEVLLLQEDYGGPAENNEVLKAVAPMPMTLRRHMCVGLIGKNLRTMDNMAAFAKSVNFVVAERELGKIKSITRHALADNDQFYGIFKEALREADKA